MPGLYDTEVLTGTVNSLQTVPLYLTDTFFPKLVAQESEKISFDVEKDVMKLAPFVLPTVEGQVVTEKAYQTNEFTPAYIKPKSVLNPNTALKRVIGEQLLGSLTNEQRMMLRIANLLEDHQTMIRRRLEWMAASVLRTGAVTVAGDKYPAVTVNFGRAAALTVTLSSGSKWSDSGVDPLANLGTWAQLILDNSGSPTNVVVMDKDAWNVFKSNPFVQSRLGLQRVQQELPTLNQSPMKMLGGVRKGVVDEFEIWVYTNTYVDDSGTVQKMLPSGTVLMIGEMLGVQQYGAIMDEAAGLQALPYFSKSWVENDPPLRFVMTQSAPLLVPYRVNATLGATVL